MNYLEQPLLFINDKIYYQHNNSTNETDCFEVMMEWEHSLMSASAAYVCEGGGDILEIGFGMGISAGYIQSHSIDSHTIVENHPDIIPKAVAWASNKSNVNIISGSWYRKMRSSDGITWTNIFSTYDGLFYDTYGDSDMQYFSSSLSSYMKPGGRACWWNSITGSNNYYNIPDVTYEIIDIDPPKNNYFNHKQYYLPKKEF